MFGKLFKKQEEAVSIAAPASGEVTALEKVPDPVFSEKMMGDGVAIKPVNGEVVVPVVGKIIQVFPTKHAVGIQAANGAEILIHIGLETVSLDGEGFTSHVEEGQKVKQGDKLIEFDMELVVEKASSTITPVIISNTGDMQEIQKLEKMEVTAGVDEILIVK